MHIKNRIKDELKKSNLHNLKGRGIRAKKMHQHSMLSYFFVCS